MVMVVMVVAVVVVVVQVLKHAAEVVVAVADLH